MDHLQTGPARAIFSATGTGTLDTLAIARRLQAAGFSSDQAEAVTGALRDARDTDLSILATRTDLAGATFEILNWVLSAIGLRTIVIVGALVALAKGLH